MHRAIVVLLFVCGGIFSIQSQTKYQKDFDYMWNLLNSQYAYFDAKETDWEKVKEIYSKKTSKITKNWEFIQLVENVMYELYDPHMSINTNLTSSFRLIPNDSDAWVEYQDGNYVIVDVRPDYEAEEKGVPTGAILKAVNGKDIHALVKAGLPKATKSIDYEQRNFMANQVLAGRHDEKRELTLLIEGKERIYQLGKPKPKKASEGILTSKVLKNDIGYIKVNNSLGNNNLIKAFDSVVNSFKTTKAIVLDLRETHGGGNTTVARAIMGKFIQKEMFYQKHEYPAEERYYGIKRSWMEYVSPLKEVYLKPVIVLVGRWTGSVGEALAVGFDRIPTAKVVGTKMARLFGAITCYRFSETDINLCFPFEKLYHVDGTPREDFIPKNRSKNSRNTYQLALELLKNE